VASLIEKSLVGPEIIRDRTALLPNRAAPVVTERILAWLDSISPPS